MKDHILLIWNRFENGIQLFSIPCEVLTPAEKETILSANNQFININDTGEADELNQMMFNDEMSCLSDIFKDNELTTGNFDWTELNKTGELKGKNIKTVVYSGFSI